MKTNRISILALLCAATAVANIAIETVPVGDPGNATNPSVNRGAVNYVYNIGKFEVKASEYAAFLNSVAAIGDPYGLWNTNMESDGSGGITRTGSGPFAYSVKPGHENQPVNNVTWFNALRFANWMTNGQGGSDTENGTYTLSGSGPFWTVTFPTDVQRAAWATNDTGKHWVLPSENEWFKAAYYKGGGTNAGYWLYPNRSNTAPVWGPPPTGGANYLDAAGLHAVTGTAGYNSATNYLTDCGAYSGIASPYGTFDQGGNVWEWTDTFASSTLGRVRGGGFDDPLSALGNNSGITLGSDGIYYDVGFRMASIGIATGIWSGGSGGTWDATDTNWINLVGTPWNTVNGASNKALFTTVGDAAALSGTVVPSIIQFNESATVNGLGTLGFATTTSTMTINVAAGRTATINADFVGAAAANQVGNHIAKTGSGTLILSGATNLVTGDADTSLSADYIVEDGGTLQITGPLKAASVALINNGSSNGTNLIGHSSASNTVTVNAGGRVISGGVFIGDSTFGGNSLTISTPGTQTSPSYHILGYNQTVDMGVSSSNNSLTINNGAYFIFTNGGGTQTLKVGVNAGSNNNVILVDGAGSTLDRVNPDGVVTGGQAPGVSGSFVSVGVLGSNNSLTVSNGGNILPRRISVGEGGTNNTWTVTTGATGASADSSNAAFQVGSVSGAMNNSFVLSAGGKYFFNGTTTGSPANRTFGVGIVAGADNNFIQITGAGSQLNTNTAIPLAVGGTAQANVISNGGNGNHLDVLDGGKLVSTAPVILAGGSVSDNTVFNLGDGVGNTAEAIVGASVAQSNTYYVNQKILGNRLQTTNRWSAGGQSFTQGVNLTTPNSVLRINNGRLTAGEDATMATAALVSGLGIVDLAGPAFISIPSGNNNFVSNNITGSGLSLGGITKEGDGTLTLLGSNTYIGNTAVSAGTLILADTGALKFTITDSSNNRITGAGIATFNGSFNIDTSAVTIGSAYWTLVDVSTKSFGPDFLVAGFTPNADGVTWTKADGPKAWTFNESTGILSVNFADIGVSVGAPGALPIGSTAPGNLSSVGQLDEWTFYGRQGGTFTVAVNPGSGVFRAPIFPQLAWANVELLDANNNVLSSAANSTAGTILYLRNNILPADGTYKIRITAASTHPTATGNYLVTVWNAPPNVRSLNIGQRMTGNITAPYGLDLWNFSASAGNFVQFDLIASSTSGLAFKLTGPENITLFQDITGDSAQINLPSSGNYTLSAYGINDAKGSYSFVMNQTSLTDLAPGEVYNGTWVGSGQSQLFAVQTTAANPLSVVLTDTNTANHTELYARFGSPPTRTTYDFAINGSGASHSLIVPLANAGTWYVLVYGESIPSSSGNFTFQATSTPVLLSGTSLRRTASNIDSTFTLTGAGFTAGSAVTLVASSGTEYAATSSSTDSPTQITAFFAQGQVPGGDYTLKVTQPDGSSYILPTPIHIVQVGQGVLTTNIEAPSPVGRHGAATFYVTYANTGNAPMPAPLLIFDASNPSGQHGAYLTLDASIRSSGFWTSATPAGFSNSIQILANGATPGVLQPGESFRVPVYYAGWNLAQWNFSDPRLNFSLTTIKPDDATPVDWASREASMRPSNMSAEAWHIVYAGLLAQLGSTAGGFVQLLDNQATYLARLGQNVTDVNRLWGFAVTQAQAVWPMPTIGGTVDDSLPTPGALSLSFGRAFNQTIPGRFRAGPLGLGWFTPWQQRVSVAGDGTVTLESGSGGNAIYQPDSRYSGRYFSQPGDHNIFTAGGGGYQLTAPNGMVTTFNSNGTLNYLEDTNGNRITAGYTGSQLTTLTSSSGKSLTLAYNGAGLISTLTDSLGRVTSYSYDAANLHLLSVTSFTGRVTSYAYNTTAASPALNALSTITFPDGTHQYFTHDSAGRIASTYADGNTLTKTFTYTHGQVNTSDALNNTVSLFFDHNGQLGRTVDALGNPTIYNYDESFNLARVTNATGASAAYAYDETGKVTLSTDFLGHTTNLTYGGPQHQLTALTDANGNTTLYGYDGKGNMRSSTFANGRSEQFTYDPLGNALSFVNAAGSLTQYAYNAAGQLTSASFSDGSSFAYAYDEEGHLTTATDATGITSFTYDPVTRLLTKVEYPNGKWLSFGYDAGGRRTSMVDQGGFTTSYAYDAVGRLEWLRDGSNQLVVSYHYDEAGRLDRKDNGNGTYSTYAYDANGNVLHLINYAPDGSINSRFDDTYNSLGMKTSETTIEGIWSYTYDVTGQLVHSIFASNNTANVPNQDLAYNYDAMGNRTSTVINGVTTAYVANNMNQYTSVGGVSQSYDANGNLTADGTNTFVYNTLNKLVSTTGPSGTTTYTYNALGQRVASTSAGQTTQYLTDPAGLGNVVSTYNGSGTLISHFTHGLGLVNQTSAATFFYDFDPLGSTAGMSNSAGSYANRYSYVPFGGSLSSCVTVPNVFQFVGQLGVLTANSQLSFMRERDYFSSTGRFASIDPLRIAGGDTNYYRYVFNRPDSLSDPTGLLAASSGSGLLNKGIGDLIEGLLGRKGTGAVASTAMTAGAGGIQNGWEGAMSSFLETLIDETWGRLFPTLTSVVTELTKHPEEIVYLGAGVGYLQDPSGYLNRKVQDYLAQNGPTPQPPGGTSGTNTQVTGVTAVDPNALYGPAGYGSVNFMPGANVHFPYRIEFENDADASAPAQTVNITDNLDASFDLTSFQLTGVGFGDVNLTIPAGSQHFQKTVSMTQNGQTFDVQIEAGIHSATGQVYAIFQSIMPGTGLPPSNPLTGFLPPEDGTGRGQGFVTFTIAPKANLTTGTQITNVANIVFDAGLSISTDQIDPHDASKGTDPTKRALVTIDAVAPVSQINPLPSSASQSFDVSWSAATDDAGGSGFASYDVYVSSDGGVIYNPWLIKTTKTSARFTGSGWRKYSFYVLARKSHTPDS